MNRLCPLLLVVSALPALGAPEPEYLIRATRQARNDLTILRGAGLPVVYETMHSLFLEGSAVEIEALRERGFEVEILDRYPRESDYLHVGLRPDSDLATLSALGAELFAEGNWKLIRVPRGAPFAPLYDARVHVSRLPHEPVPLTRAPPAARPDSGTTDPLIQRMVDAVDTTWIDLYWTDLTSNPPTGTRMSTDQGCLDAVEYVRNRLELCGLPVELQSFGIGIGSDFDHAPNVIGTHLGAVTPGQVYILAGHLDDLPIAGLAPGADDNASGAVTVLESARVTSCYAFKSTIKFIAFTGEEFGRMGSAAYVEDAEARGEDIRAALNFDMNGWEGDGTPSPENLDVNYNDVSEGVGLLFAQAAADYNTGLVVDAFLCPDLYWSDHYSFWVRGYQAIWAITDNEGHCGHGGHYPYYHSSDDTIASCGDLTFFYSTIRAAVATLATLAEPFKITFEDATLALGQTAGLVVGDRDLNTDPVTAETVVVEVWSTTEPTPETFTLVEDDLDSMIFTGDVTTTTQQPVAGDGAVSVADGDVVTARYVDALDCEGSVNVAHTDTASGDGAGLVPVEVVGLTVGPGTSTHLEWHGLTNATGYDVAGGVLAELRQDGDGSRAACLADGVPASAWDDPRPDPPHGAGYYYLLRGQNANGPGTYGASRAISACP